MNQPTNHKCNLLKKYHKMKAKTMNQCIWNYLPYTQHQQTHQSTTKERKIKKCELKDPISDIRVLWVFREVFLLSYDARL